MDDIETFYEVLTTQNDPLDSGDVDQNTKIEKDEKLPHKNEMYDPIASLCNRTTFDLTPDFLPEHSTISFCDCAIMKAYIDPFLTPTWSTLLHRSYNITTYSLMATHTHVT